MNDGGWIKSYVIQVIPVLALLVYIVGFTYNMVYYYQFGVNIIYYITLSEVLVSTLVPILTVVIISIFFGASQIFIKPLVESGRRLFLKKIKKTSTLKHMARVNDYIKNINIGCQGRKILKKEIEEFKRPRIQIQMMSTISLLAVILLIIIPYNIYAGKIDVQYKHLWIFCLLITGFVPIDQYIKRYRMIKLQLTRIYSNIISTIIVFVSILICSVFLAVYDSEQDKIDDSFRFYVTIQNSLEYTNKNYVFVGECSKSIFLYDRINKSTVVLNTANLISIVYFNKKENIYTKTIEEFVKVDKQSGKSKLFY